MKPFMTTAEKKKYQEKFGYSKEKPMIITENITRPFVKEFGFEGPAGNNNVIVLGDPGSGKTESFIKPNIMQMHSSYIITDKNGELLRSTGKAFIKHGYNVKVLNLDDMQHSDHYNPFHYLHTDSDIKKFIEVFFYDAENNPGKQDEFFEHAEKLLFAACISYLLQNCEDENRKNFAGLFKMFNSVAKANKNAEAPLDELFGQLPEDCAACKNYEAFKQAAGKTRKSIATSCGIRLQPLLTQEVQDLTQKDDLELDQMDDRLTALFVIPSATNEVSFILGSLLYSQFFSAMEYKKNFCFTKYGRYYNAGIPVRCIMDTFAMFKVSELPSMLGHLYHYNISVSMVIQDIRQLEEMYQKEWKNLVAGCSTFISFKTKSVTNLAFLSSMINESVKNVKPKEEISLPSMKHDDCLVFMQTMKPIIDKKYDWQKHLLYKLTADHTQSNEYVINKENPDNPENN